MSQYLAFFPCGPPPQYPSTADTHTQSLKVFLLPLHCLLSSCSWFCHSFVMPVTEVSMKKPLCSNMEGVVSFPHLLFPAPYCILHFIWVLLLLQYIDILGVLMDPFLNIQDERVRIYISDYPGTDHLLNLTPEQDELSGISLSRPLSGYDLSCGYLERNASSPIFKQCL